MSAFFALLRHNFVALLSNSFSVGIKQRHKPKPKATPFFSLIFLVGIMGFIAVTYSFSMGMAFQQMGMLEFLPRVMITFGLFFSLVLTMYSAQAHVFSVKDIDFTLSLPVSHFTIMLSKILALYLEILLITEIFAVSCGVAYVMFGGSVAAVPLLFISGIFLAFIPTLIGLIIGFVMAFIMSKVKNKSLVGIIMNFVFMAAVFATTFTITGNSNNPNTDIDSLQRMFATFLAPVDWAVRFALDYSILHFVLLVFCCLVPFLLVAWLFSKFYKKILTGLSGSVFKNNYKFKLADMGGGNAFSALMGKEFKRFVGSPIYFMNAGTGYILLIVGAIVAVVMRGKIMEYIGMLEATAGIDVSVFIAPVILVAISFFAFMVMPSSVSISLEGNTLWILKSLPVDVRMIFMVKTGLSFIISAGAMAFAGILMGIAFSLNFIDVFLILLFCILTSLFMSMLCLFINLLLPKLDSDNDAVVVKQSASVVVCMFVSWLLIGLFVGLYFLLGANFHVFCGVASALVAVLCFVVALLLETTGRKRFAQL